MKDNKKIQTKKNEVIMTTSNTDEMYGKYLVKPLFRKWYESVLDESTGEIFQIERNEMVLEKGTYLMHDQLAVINFHLQAGDVTEVTVSDQKRCGIFSAGWGVQPWCVTAKLTRKHKYLLFARNIFQALEIAQDYLELHCDINFSLTSAKEYKDHIFIFDDTVKLVDDKGVEKPETEVKEERVYVYMFYSIEANVTLGEDNERSYRFLIYAKDVEDAKLKIEKHVREKIAQKSDENGLGVVDSYIAKESMKINVISATKVNCAGVIGLEFTEAYNKKDEE